MTPFLKHKQSLSLRKLFLQEVMKLIKNIHFFLVFVADEAFFDKFL